MILEYVVHAYASLFYLNCLTDGGEIYAADSAKGYTILGLLVDGGM